MCGFNKNSKSTCVSMSEDKGKGRQGEVDVVVISWRERGRKENRYRLGRRETG